ncbi:MAG: hypothetical protein AVDCRST_MAG86-3074 [uncultured Truepera sp.]|uniref:GGDEF domain-containing protein n=1 Tax=uncultured Truepera sp. TaxID=543023 RepID=A0A6J4VM71_9DEIN|nr:MAG: hypothetical protein AVDCRST_MAG86-3074 [uncultured Truepera sp.]
MTLTGPADVAEAWALRRTDPARAQALSRDLLSAATGRGDLRGSAYARLTLAFCQLDAADYGVAAEHLTEAAAHFAALADAAGGAEVELLQGVIACRRGRYDAALEKMVAVLESSEHPNAEAIQARALMYAGEVYGYRGDFERSRDLLHRALTLSADPYTTSENLLVLSRTYRSLGEYERALRYGLEALAGKRSSGDLLGEAYALNNLGLIYHDPYDSAQALSYYLQGLALSEKLGNRRSKMALLGNLGELYADLGDHEKAIEYTHQSLTLSEEIGSQHTAGISLEGLGIFYARLEDHVSALNFYRRALELREKIGDKQGQASTLHHLGALYGATFQGEQASGYYHQSLTLAREIGHPYTEARVLASLGGFYVQEDQLQEARRHFEDALALAQQMKLLGLVRDCSEALYSLYKRQLDFGRALSYLETLHETDRTLADERAARRTQLLLIQFDLERTQQAAEIQRLRNVELAQANRALHEKNRQNAKLLERLREQAKRLQQQATEDSLTGLYNRRYAERHLKKEFRRAGRYSRPLTIAIADIDNLKEINDTFSHAVGDSVLRTVADLLTAPLRPADIAARYGGEEFVLVLPETDAAGGRVVCEKLCRAVEAHPWHDLHPDLRVTLSVGLCSDFGPGSHEKMLAAADNNLYRAKCGGKNQVVT